MVYSLRLLCYNPGMITQPPAQQTRSYAFPIVTGSISTGVLLLVGLLLLVTALACSATYECGLGWVTMGLLYIHFIFVTPTVIILAIIGTVQSAKLTTRRALCLTLNIIGLTLNTIAGLSVLLWFLSITMSGHSY